MPGGADVYYCKRKSCTNEEGLYYWWWDDKGKHNLNVFGDK